MKNALLLATLLVACSSTPATNNPVDGGGGDTSNPNNAMLKGRIVGFGAGSPIKGATVTIGTGSATTDDKGFWSLSVAKATPVSMTVTNPGYVKLIEQEMIVSGDSDRGDTSFVPAGTQQLLEATLTGIDPTLAVVSFRVYARGGGCPTAQGSTVAFATPGSEKLLYFAASGFPDPGQTSVIDGKTPSGIFYNVPVGASIKLKVTPPAGCKQSTFPIADLTIPTLTYTGNVNSEAGDPPPAGSKAAASFIRIYIE